MADARKSQVYGNRVLDSLLTQRAVEFKMGCVFCHQALHIDASTET